MLTFHIIYVEKVLSDEGENSPFNDKVFKEIKIKQKRSFILINYV